MDNRKTFESKVSPGAVFILRRLNVQQRALRDLEIAKEKMEYGDLVRRYISITEEWESREDVKAFRQSLREKYDVKEKDGALEVPDEHRAAYNIAWAAFKVENQPQELKDEIRLLNVKIELYGKAYIMPTTIRAAVIRIEGLKIHDKPCTTAEQFLENCEDEKLIDEIWTEAEILSGLTIKKAEVFSGPSASDEAAAGMIPSTTATPATASDTGNPGTVPSSTPST